MKSRGTRAVIYTCRYSIGHFNSANRWTELGIKLFTRISEGDEDYLVSLLCITMILINSKITIILVPYLLG